MGKDIYIYENVGVPLLWRPKLATQKAYMSAKREASSCPCCL